MVWRWRKWAESPKPSVSWAAASKKNQKHAELTTLEGYLAVQEARIGDALEAFKLSQVLDPAAGAALANSCFSSLYADFMDARAVTDLHKDAGDRIASVIRPGKITRPASQAGRRIRVGYLSPDLRNHPVGFFMEPILRYHNHEDFELHGYGLNDTVDEFGNSLINCFDRWRPCSQMTDSQLAARIRDDAIDILVDLGGYTASSRMSIPAMRVAPVQVSYLGYPCTTGLPEMDTIIGDHWLMPAGSRALYSESPARLDTSFLCFQPRPGTPDVAPLPAERNGYITFGSFNHLPKLSDRCITLWADVLQEIPNSKLVLKAQPLADAGVQELTYRRFAKAGITRTRVELLGPNSPVTRFLQEYARIDIALDTTPYNGGTTTCDALWMGVPVISLYGEHFYERMGLSILSCLGRPEWAVATPGEFVDKAAALAADRPTLGAIRSNLRQAMRSSALCDAPGFTAGLEENYRKLLLT